MAARSIGKYKGFMNYEPEAVFNVHRDLFHEFHQNCVTRENSL